jgi:hypothetical protein
MELTLLLYLASVLSATSFGFSIYTLNRVLPKKKEKIVEQRKTETRVVSEVAIVPTISVSPEAIFVTTPPDKEVGHNNWELDITGQHGFDLNIEWSNGKVSCLSDTAPTQRTYNRDAGMFPTKVVGVSPRYDHKVQFSWKLNGFHWS